MTFASGAPGDEGDTAPVHAMTVNAKAAAIPSARSPNTVVRLAEGHSHPGVMCRPFHPKKSKTYSTPPVVDTIAAHHDVKSTPPMM
jgi:hypothetical protein